MIEQYTDGKCDTFAAYDFLGMKKDYREYSSIKDILKILNIICSYYFFIINFRSNLH